MQKLSAIIIAKNGEKMIGECIKSLEFCDEVIVVDGRSADKTVAKAKEMGAKVLSSDSDDFSKQRNLGLEKSAGEWVLYVDTDERVSEPLREEIIKVIKNPQNKYSAFRVKRKNFYLGNHEWKYIEHILRLFKKESLKGWMGQLHESPQITGSVGELGGFLLHYTHRDLSSMVEKTNEWSEIEAKLRFENNHPKMTWWRFFRVMLTAFYDSYIRQSGWRVGIAGFIESVYQSFSIFITYAKLWEMQEKRNNKNKT